MPTVRRLASAIPPQAFIKVNQYYVLYTYPIVPYLDPHSVFMVGLEGFGRVIDHYAGPNQEPWQDVPYATVAVDKVARTAALTFDGHHLTFRAGSRDLDADGRRFTMPAAAIWDVPSGQMVVPLVSLTRALGLTTRWDPARRTMNVIGPPDLTRHLDRSEYGGAIQDEISNMWNMGHTEPDTEALVPVSARLVRGAAADAGTERGTRIELAVRNTSGVTLGSEEWVNMEDLYAGDGQSGGDDTDVSFAGHGRGPVPPIPPYGIRRVNAVFPWTGTPICVLADPVTLVPHP